VLPGETLIFIVTPNRDEPLLERRKLAADTLRGLSSRIVEDFSADNINPAHPEWTTDLEYLRPLADDLVLSIMDHLADADVVYIVPHGDLFYFPFHALRVDSDRYLIEEKPIAYAPSATLLQNARLLRRQPGPASFLGVGVGKEADPPTRKEDFQHEVELLAKGPFWSKSETLLGLEASKAEFLKRMGQFDVVHIACHGDFNGDDPMGSGLLLSNGARLPDESGPNPGMDGSSGYILSAREMARLSMKATLVYLSACVSGRADTGPGDEIMGVVRSLIRAEVATAVVSLWPVSASQPGRPGPTRMLTQRFYEAWLGQGLSKVQALRTAQIETMQLFPHPYHWAPFSLVGDWA
jgi:CHAT domain-containing protein